MHFQSPLIAIAAIVLGYRLTRQANFDFDQLWMMPLAIILTVGLSFHESPPDLLAMIASVAGAILGAALGWLRSTSSIIGVDTVERQILTRPSALAPVFFAGSLLLRLALHHAHLPPVQWTTDFAMCFSAASICAKRLSFYAAFRRETTVG